MGEQPLATLLSELQLTPAKLVRASSDQLNHKMVSRGMKGRRLTGNVMKKIRNALNAATEKSYKTSDLFDYAPLNSDSAE
ncbi:MAG: hypothetical protein ACI8TQ_000995 [Planctomycetota bacterium]|jgi:hypothetical protein